MALIPNQQPALVLNRNIKVKTSFDGSSLSESHRVIGPLAQNLRTTVLSGGKKTVIPLTETLGQGGHFLKIHMPTDYIGSNDSTVYVTFCRKNLNYVDGYQDYATVLPEAYINSIKLWIDNGQTPNTEGTSRVRNLTFSTYGRETNQVENSRMFKMAFAYVGVVDVETETNTGIDPVGTGVNLEIAGGGESSIAISRTNSK